MALGIVMHDVFQSFSCIVCLSFQIMPRCMNICKMKDEQVLKFDKDVF